MKKQLLIFILFTGLLSSCIEDNFDQPPTTGSDPNIEVTATIAELKAMYTGTAMELSDTLVISGIVVADDESGNFYKSIVIQDATGGILIRMNSTTLYQTYPVGRRLFIKLGGMWIGEYNGLIQLGVGKSLGTINEVDPIPSTLFDTFILRGTMNNDVIPVDVNILDLDDSYQNMLIRLQNVQYIVADTNKTYAPGLTSQSIYLEDCGGNQIIVRTSGYSTFANAPVENLNGEFVAVYSVYGADKQLIVRDLSDVKMNGVRCGPYARKDFEDASVTSGGWTTYQITGGASINWTTNTMGAVFGTRYGQCSNYINPSNFTSDTWLISPSMDFTSAVNPILTFQNACNYSGPNLVVKVSSNYVSGDPSAAAWTTLTPVLSGGSWAWVSSGNLSLSAFNGQSNVHVAFQYIGTASSGKTYEIDEIVIAEQ
jgi:hypothetical protein